MPKAWLELARISNLPTVWTNAAAAWLLSGGTLGERGLLWCILGGSLLYTAGMILNDAADLAFDRAHRSDRPIPSGRVSPGAAWGVGTSLIVVGAFIMIVPGQSRWPWVVALVAAIVAYDLYHKPWPGSVLIMGACRSLLVLAVASANGPDGSLGDRWHLLGYAGALGLYIVGLSLVARAEATGAIRTPQGAFGMTCLFAPLVLAIVFGLTDASSAAALGVPGAAFAVLAWQALGIMRHGGPSIGRAVGMLLAGIPMVDAVAVAGRQPWAAIAFVALFPVLRLWQRKIAAT